MSSVIDFILHFDKHFLSLIEMVGMWSYVVLFAVIFAETGLVVAPFLPGDSLLFVAGTLAGSGHLNIFITYVVLLAAAILGDTVNYWIGHYIGPKVFENKNSKIFKKEYLEKTREFYDKHGGKAIILARFLPILRTFAPFVAGVGKMHYETFIKFNVIGAAIWVTLFIFAGYFFGMLPFIQENFHYTTLLIILISLMPMVYEYVQYRRGLHLTKAQMSHATYKEVVKTVKD
jgi:membrane-associated protein